MNRVDVKFHAIGEWPPSGVITRRVADSRPRWPELEAEIDRAWAEATDRAGAILFDGPLCRLERFSAEEPGILRLDLNSTSFKIFFGTNLRHPEWAEQFGPEILANPLGVSTVLESADGFLLLGRRSDRVACYPGRVHPFAGTVEEREPMDLFAEAMRELEEEVNLKPAEVRGMICIGLIEDRALRQPELVFGAGTRFAFGEIQELLEKTEHSAVVAIAVKADAVLAAAGDPALTPGAAAAILLGGGGISAAGGLTPRGGRLRWSAMSLSDDLQFSVDLARAASKIVLEHYGRVTRLTKRNDEAVSEADRHSQRFIIEALRRRFPGEGIVGEENESGDAITFDVANPDGRNWVIDPIDGTNNFLAGLGAFAVCIGLLDAGQPVLGVVYDVTRDLAYAAAKGSGAWLGKRRLTVCPTPMGDSTMIMLSSNLIDADGNAPAFATRWLGQTTWKIRILGSAALEAAMVAAGVAHGAITINGKLWDVAAPAALVIEAGGLMTDPRGRPIFPFDLRGYTGAKVPFLAACPSAQAELLRHIQSGP